MIIDTMDEFISRVAERERFTVMVLDNASIHTSRRFECQLQRWFCQRVII